MPVKRRLWGYGIISRKIRMNVHLIARREKSDVRKMYKKKKQMFDAIWCISNVIAHDTRSVDNRATDIVPLWSISDVPLLWCLIGVLWDWDILSLQILFTSLSLCIVPTLSILYLQQGTSGTIIITVISLILLQELLWKLYTNRIFYDLVLYWYRHTYITHHRGNDSENTGKILRAHEGCTYLYVDRGTYPTARGHLPKATGVRALT